MIFSYQFFITISWFHSLISYSTLSWCWICLFISEFRKTFIRFNSISYWNIHNFGEISLQNLTSIDLSTCLIKMKIKVQDSNYHYFWFTYIISPKYLKNINHQHSSHWRKTYMKSVFMKCKIEFHFIHFAMIY